MNLRPCPWCGTKPSNKEDIDGFVVIQCENTINNCPVHPTVFGLCSEEAVTKWNIRYD